jgi:hypothetical protein
MTTKAAMTNKPPVAPFRDCRLECGQAEPGICAEDSDFSQRKTTRSEQRVEDHLDEQDLNQRRLLHVGVGNSSLAQRLAASLSAIDGITIMANEKVRADQLGLKNYHVAMLNKFSNALPGALPGGYDYIVDVNLSSFCCCRSHFHAMLTAYRTLLRPGGFLLTDLDGMLWIEKGVDRRWLLDFDDLVWLASHYDWEPVPISDMILALRKPAVDRPVPADDLLQ